MLELELLAGVEVLQGMRLRALGLHATHEGGRVGLTAGRRHHTVAGHLRRHARLGSRLARVMSHAGRHGVSWVHAWVLLHSGMEAATRSHTGHHGGPYLQCLVVDYPPTWIPTPRPPRFFVGAIQWVWYARPSGVEVGEDWVGWGGYRHAPKTGRSNRGSESEAVGEAMSRRSPPFIGLSKTRTRRERGSSHERLRDADPLRGYRGCPRGVAIDSRIGGLMHKTAESGRAEKSRRGRGRLGMPWVATRSKRQSGEDNKCKEAQKSQDGRSDA